MSKKLFPIEKDSITFLDRCSSIIAEHHRDQFNQDTWCEWQDLSISSPIEQRLYAAMKLVAVVNNYDFDGPEEIDACHYIVGLDIKPQAQIDKYRVDFLVSSYRYPKKNADGSRHQEVSRVIVECDSQQWHERTEMERRYEKARDRHFMKAGYKVFHFTGKEIMNDPFDAASEVLAFVVSTDKELIRDSVRDIEVNL